MAPFSFFENEHRTSNPAVTGPNLECENRFAPSVMKEINGGNLLAFTKQGIKND